MKLGRKTLIASTCAALAFIGKSSWGQSDGSRIEELEAQTSELSLQLEELRAELEEAKLQTDLANPVPDVSRDATTSAHLTGYAAAGFSKRKGGDGEFDVANFNPIFHFLHGDRLLWESELEVEVSESGETEIELEYSTIDIFLNDYLVFVTGKFNSPLGNFRQNLHPAWINKLPSAPPGFGHDGAAPLADVGFQLRGGRPVGDGMHLTYASYVGNGPRLEGEDGELHGVDTDGFTSSDDGENTVGARVSLLPLARLEIGLSGAWGDAAIVENDELELVGDPARDYRVDGLDITYQRGDFDVRGEFISQKIGSAPLSVAPESAEWETWYVQGAYKFGQARWEAVLRYTDFDSPHSDESQEQWAVGLNYLVTPSAMIKLGYESNDGLPGEQTDSDRWLLQVAYGY